MIGARMAMWQSYGEFEGLTVEAVQAGTFSLKAVPPASIIEKEPQPPEVFLQSSLDGGTTLQEFVAGESKV